jgi:hypothetical protein
MINETNRPAPDLSKMTRTERIAYFSAATEKVVPLGRPARRLPPRARRNSVRHRAIR